MKRFLRGQEKGKLKDISCFMLPRYDVDNLIFINNNFQMYKIRWDFFNASDDSDDSDDDDDDDGDDDDDSDNDIDVGDIIDSDDDDIEDSNNVYPGFKEIYDIFKLFFSKIKYEGCDSDSDSDIEDFDIILPDSDDDSYSDNF